MPSIDHLALSSHNLSEGVLLAGQALGTQFAGGGKHDLMGTHNQLLGLGDLYLEVIAVDPQAQAVARPRWFDLDNFSGAPRLTNWVVRCDNLEAALAVCPQGMGVPVQLERGAYRWRMAVPQDGRLPFDGCFPALIEWQGSAHPAQALPDSGLRLRRLVIAHPEAARLSAALSSLLQDDRLLITHGDHKQMKALFEGPEGETWLS
jgi:hypothetical protein